MKLSDEQFVRVSTLSPLERVADHDGLVTISPLGETRPEEARRIATELLEETSSAHDMQRDEIVASLRERIESGAYQVSGAQVAEMLVRRMVADSLT
jgi:hypothetical protein